MRPVVVHSCGSTDLPRYLNHLATQEHLGYNRILWLDLSDYHPAVRRHEPPRKFDTGLGPKWKQYFDAHPDVQQLLRDVIRAIHHGGQSQSHTTLHIIVTCSFGKHRSPYVAQAITDDLRHHTAETRVAHFSMQRVEWEKRDGDFQKFRLPTPELHLVRNKFADILVKAALRISGQNTRAFAFAFICVFALVHVRIFVCRSCCCCCCCCFRFRVCLFVCVNVC